MLRRGAEDSWRRVSTWCQAAVFGDRIALEVKGHQLLEESVAYYWPARREVVLLTGVDLQVLEFHPEQRSSFALREGFQVSDTNRLHE